MMINSTETTIIKKRILILNSKDIIDSIRTSNKEIFIPNNAEILVKISSYDEFMIDGDTPLIITWEEKEIKND